VDEAVPDVARGEELDGTLPPSRERWREAQPQKRAPLRKKADDEREQADDKRGRTISGDSSSWS
jgi:hypothetical protein